MTTENKAIGLFVMGTIALVVFLLAWPFAQVDTGEIGIVRQWGDATRTMSPGMHFKMPIMESVDTLNTRVQNVELTADAASNDLQSMKALVAVNYRLDSTPNMVLETYRTLGKEYEANVLRPAIQSSTKAGTAEFSSTELITSRLEAQDRIEEILKGRITEYGIIITRVNLVNVDFSDKFDQAIEEKQQKEQEVMRERSELELITIQAQQKIVQAEATANATLTIARAEATAMKLKQNAINSELVAMAYVEKWNGVLPQTMLGDSDVLMTVGQ